MSYNFSFYPQKEEIHVHSSISSWVGAGYNSLVNLFADFSISPPAARRVVKVEFNEVLDETLKKITRVADAAARERQFIALSESELALQDPLKVIRTFARFHSESSALNSYIDRVVNAFFGEMKLEKAEEAIGHFCCDSAENELLKDEYLVKIADSWLKDGKYEQAFDCIKTLRAIHPERHRVLVELFTCHLAAKNFKSAHRVIGALEDSIQPGYKEACLIQLAEICLMACDWDCASEVICEISLNRDKKAQLTALLIADFENITKVTDSELREPLFLAYVLANPNCKDPVKVIETFVSYHRTSSKLNSYILKVANSLKETDRELAQRVMICFSSGKKEDQLTKDNFIVSLAESWLDEGHYERSFNCIRNLQPWNTARHQALVKLFKCQLIAGDFKSALSITRSIDESTQSVERESCLMLLAETCIENKSWEFASKAINEIKRAEKRKIFLTESLIDSCIKNHDIQSAFICLNSCKEPEIPEHRFLLAKICCKVLRSFVAISDVERCKACIKKIISPLLVDSCSINGVDKKYRKSVGQSERMKKYTEHLTEQCFTLLDDFFKQEDVIGEFNRFVMQHSSLEMFEEYFNITEDPSTKPPSKPSSVHKPDFRLFTVLGVEPTATFKEVKSAYKKIARANHTDKLMQKVGESEADFKTRKDKCTVKLAAANTAYQALCKYFES